MAGTGGGVRAKIRAKVEPEPKLNNFGSATLISIRTLKISVVDPE